MATYIGIVRDHSASMRRLRAGAASDYNLTLEGIRQSEVDEGQASLISVVECGVGPLGAYRLVEAGMPASKMETIADYHTTGSATPLWDSVGAAIEACRTAARVNGDADAVETAFLIMAITDGQENRSQQWTARSLSAEIARLQATDRWTFVFRVPHGDKAPLTRLGIPAGNIMEWEQSEAALSQSTQTHVASVQGYLRARASGVRSSTSFYADASTLSKEQVRESLDDITRELRSAAVRPNEDGKTIKDFCIEHFGTYAAGCALYQLSKTEKVQDYKRIAIRDVATGAFYSGPAARTLLGLPPQGEIKLVPAQVSGRFDIFVQSNSFTRKLVGGTTVVYVG